jgi:hypothetical protein
MRGRGGLLQRPSTTSAAADVSSGGSGAAAARQQRHGQQQGGRPLAEAAAAPRHRGWAHHQLRLKHSPSSSSGSSSGVSNAVHLGAWLLVLVGAWLMAAAWRRSGRHSLLARAWWLPGPSSSSSSGSGSGSSVLPVGMAVCSGGVFGRAAGKVGGCKK